MDNLLKQLSIHIGQSFYKALRWPLPKNPAEEHKIGQELTKYLWRGSNQNSPNFENTGFE